MNVTQSVDFRGTDQLWPVIDATYKDMETVESSGQPATSLAARQVDRAQAAGHRPYISAYRLLTIARENHQAFLGHIEAMGFGPHAPFNLLRPVLESSLWAIWLLDPAQSSERRRRGLHFEVLDHKAEVAYLDELGRMSEGREFRDAAARRQATAGSSYRKDADAMGLDYGTLKGLNLTDQIPKLQWIVNQYGSDYARLITAEWRRLSGYQHTKAWASVLGSDRTFIAKIEGGEVAHLVASDDGISLAVGTSGLVFLEALRLFIHRCTQPA